MNTIEGIDQKKIDEKISLVSAVTAVSLLASQQAGADQNDREVLLRHFPVSFGLPPKFGAIT